MRQVEKLSPVVTCGLVMLQGLRDEGIHGHLLGSNLLCQLLAGLLRQPSQAAGGPLQLSCLLNNNKKYIKLLSRNNLSLSIATIADLDVVCVYGTGFGKGK